MKPERCGGSFDPCGCRAVDVYRADDLVAMVEALKHRKFLCVTLTTRRDLFLSPELAYQRAQSRVPKVLSALGRVWISTIEVQTKTGDGWIHWHALVMTDALQDSADVLKRARQAVWSKWSIREQVADAVVDRETGEVISPARFKRESLGRVDVQWAKSHGGAARYAAKYLVKSWPAVPPWMGESTRKFRKFRFSSASYEVLERLHRHTRDRGSRRSHRPMMHRPARSLFERMSRSCSRMLCFSEDGRFVGRIAVAVQSCADRPGIEPLRLGRWASVRLLASPEAVRSLLMLESDRSYRADQRRELRERRWLLSGEWERMQLRRAADGC